MGSMLEPEPETECQDCLGFRFFYTIPAVRLAMWSPKTTLSVTMRSRASLAFRNRAQIVAQFTSLNRRITILWNLIAIRNWQRFGTLCRKYVSPWESIYGFSAHVVMIVHFVESLVLLIQGPPDLDRDSGANVRILFDIPWHVVPIALLDAIDLAFRIETDLPATMHWNENYLLRRLLLFYRFYHYLHSFQFTHVYD